MVSEVGRAYSERSAEYIELFGSTDSAHPLDRQLVATWADGLSGPVVDAGCGPGQWTDFLVRHGCDARGVDQVPSFVERAQGTYPGVPFEVGSIDELRDASGTAGGVLAWYSLIHHEPSAVQAPLREFARVLRPGAGLLVGLFTWPTVERFDHAVVSAYRWPLDGFAQELRTAGFEVLETHERIQTGARPLGAIVARRQG
jgi:SAM-dependent methyltransferase